MFLGLFGLSAEGSVLNWNNVTYTPGATSRTYNIDGIQVTVSLSWNNWYNRPGFGMQNPNPFERPGSSAPNYPQIDDQFTGGLTTNNDSLTLLVPETTFSGNRLDSGFYNRQSTLTVTITFSSMVTGVNFSIFDIDYAANDFQDLITVTASNGTTTFLPSTTHPNNSTNTILSPGVVRGTTTNTDTSNRGNATFNFGAAEFNSISITYGNGPSAPNQPQGQGVALHSIFFTIVPEAETAWALVPVGVVAGVQFWRRRFASAAVKPKPIA